MPRSPNLDLTQRSAYQRGFVHLLEAYDRLADVRSANYLQTIVLNAVYGDLLLAIESFGDVAAGELDLQTRRRIREERA
jgi:hypothetical protein